MDWAGYFINLDRSPGRRAAIEGMLGQLGIFENYRRFPAVEGGPHPTLKPGQVGCYHSHLNVLSAAPRDGRFIHVLEDDAILSRYFVSFLKHPGTNLDGYDLIFTDVSCYGNLPLVRDFKKEFDKASKQMEAGAVSIRLLNLQHTHFLGSTSYLVNPRSLDKVTQSLQRGHSAGKPIDLYVSDEVFAGSLRAAVAFPFLTSIKLDDSSTIFEKSHFNRAFDLLRASFFIDQDISILQAHMRAILPHEETAHDRLMSDFFYVYLHL